MQSLKALVDAIQVPCFFLEWVNEGWTVIAQNSLAETKLGFLSHQELLQLEPYLTQCAQNSMGTSFTGRECCGQVKKVVWVSTPYLSEDHQGILLQYFMQELASSHAEPNEMEVRFNLVVAGSKGGIYDWDILHDRLYWSDRMKAIMGASSYTFSGKADAFWDRLHPEDKQQVEDALQGHLVHCWPFDVECRVRTDAGYYVWVELTGQAIWDDHGKAVRMAGSVVDISDRKRAQTELEERERLTENILDSLPLNIVVKDGHGCLRFYNEENEKITGLSRSNVLGRTDFEIFPPEVAHKQMLDDLRLRKEGGLLLGEENFQMNGEDVWMLTGKKLLNYKPYGTTTENWILGFSIDITERKRNEIALIEAKEAAETAVRAKSDFLSTMSHEIRTPLNSVIGTAGLLMDTTLANEQLQHVRLIKQSGEHLLGLINDILDFSKLEAGKMLLEQEAFVLADQYQLVTTILSEQAKAKSLQLKFRVSPDIPEVVLGDAHKIRQVLLNLTSNAIKFTSQGEVLLDLMMVSSSGDQVSLCFSVSDTGIGIPEEKVSQLFKEFTQVDASTTRKYGGTGLGLAICKKIVTMMEGEIGVHSQLGVGSRFWFTIPLTVSDRKALKQEDTTSDILENVRELSILVAEDNAANQMLVKAILKKLGHQVEIANHGREALEKLTQANYDLVLMDMQMPEMDGIEATQCIRQMPGLVADIPIIALTANALEGDKERVLAAGMNDYLSKPIDIAKLKAVLARWSATPRF